MQIIIANTSGCEVFDDDFDICRHLHITINCLYSALRKGYLIIGNDFLFINKLEVPNEYN